MNNNFFLIAGPCVIESREHTLKMAKEIKEITDKLNINLIFKASFDKANRTSIKSFRGPGIKEGLKILKEVKETYNLPILTDVHTPDQCQEVAEVVDILQIPAFLSRQTDLLISAAQTGRDINIKKGQFCNHITTKHAYQKVKEVWDLQKKHDNKGQIEELGVDFSRWQKWETLHLSPLRTSPEQPRCILTDRGSIFGSDDLIVDFRSIPRMHQISDDVLVIQDATHALQQPNREGHTLGLREFIPTIARCAIASGVDGLFMEVHDDPSKALSDKTTQWYLNKLEPLLKELLDIYHVSKGRETNYLDSEQI